MKLVCRKTHRIDARLPHIHRNLPNRLRPIHMHRHPRLLTNLSDRLHRKNHPRLIIRPHKRDQRRIFIQRLPQRPHIQPPLPIHVDLNNLKPLSPQLLTKLPRRRMLNARRNDLLPRRPRRENPPHRRIHRLRPAPRKISSLSRHPTSSATFPRTSSTPLPSQLPKPVYARSVPVKLQKIRLHRLHDPRIRPRGGVVVQIDNAAHPKIIRQIASRDAATPLPV